jgi:putative lipoprotein
LKTIYTVLLLLAMHASAWADSWTGRDKPKHLAACAAIAGAAVAVGLTERQAMGAALAVGLAKELHDKRPGGTGFSWRDMAANAAGAYIGAKVGGLVIRPNFIGYTWRV